MTNERYVPRQQYIQLVVVNKMFAGLSQIIINTYVHISIC